MAHRDSCAARKPGGPLGSAGFRVSGLASAQGSPTGPTSTPGSATCATRSHIEPERAAPGTACRLGSASAGAAYRLGSASAGEIDAVPHAGDDAAALRCYVSIL